MMPSCRAGHAWGWVPDTEGSGPQRRSPSLGDGVYFTALPLQAASLTRDPVAVSLVTLATTLPNLLLTLTAGVLVDLRAPWLVAGCTELAVLAVVGRSLTSSAVERARAQAALEERPSGAVAT